MRLPEKYEQNFDDSNEDPSRQRAFVRNVEVQWRKARRTREQLAELPPREAIGSAMYFHRTR
jgi:uncharacterized protein YjiS (DUF1127 family)